MFPKFKETNCMRKFKTDMGKNSQNVIISTDGMRNIINIIKQKKNTKKLQMVAINVLDVFTAVRQSHTSTSRICE